MAEGGPAPLDPGVDGWADAMFRALGWQRAAAGGAGAGAAASGGGLVDRRRFLVTRWQQLPAELGAELRALCTALGEAIPWERPAEIEAAARAAIGALLDGMLADLQDAADAAVNDGDPGYRAVAGAVARARAACAASPVIAALSDNPILPGGRFSAAIAEALDEVERELVG